MRVVAIILTKNERIHICRAIRSLRQLDCELKIVVIDSYSDDETVRLARAEGAAVLQHPFESHAAQFSWGASQVEPEYDWMIRLDADEVLPAKLAEELCAAMSQADSSISAFALKRQHIFLDRPIRFGGRYPTVVIRAWRRGAASVEDRWMDEHVIVKHGKTLQLRNRFYDWNLNDTAHFIRKHNDYATREAIQYFLERHEGSKLHRQAARRRYLKKHFYNVLPFPIAALGYFLLRYIVQLGFLDGMPGLIYHFLQAGWYRFLVGARILEIRRQLPSTPSREQLLDALRQITGLAVHDFA